MHLFRFSNLVLKLIMRALASLGMHRKDKQGVSKKQNKKLMAMIVQVFEIQRLVLEHIKVTVFSEL